MQLFNRFKHPSDGSFAIVIINNRILSHNILTHIKVIIFVYLLVIMFENFSRFDLDLVGTQISGVKKLNR